MKLEYSLYSNNTMKRLSLQALSFLFICLIALPTIAFKPMDTANSNSEHELNHESKDELERKFREIIERYNSSPEVSKKLWAEVVSHYTGESRHYHNLEHLDNFYNQLKKCKHLTKDHDLLVVAMVYHDVIYNSPDHRDEERSADFAVERLTEIGYPKEKTEACKALILATKSHALSDDADTNYFNDADMTILGLDRATYNTYVKNVRLEYGNTPQFDTGRKRVLQYFLKMDRLFKTDFFHKIYEKSARENIAAEISTIP